MVNGLFSDFYATVVNHSYGDKLEINYFQKQYGKWVLKDDDLDSGEPKDMVLVTGYPDE